MCDAATNKLVKKRWFVDGRRLVAGKEACRKVANKAGSRDGGWQSGKQQTKAGREANTRDWWWQGGRQQELMLADGCGKVKGWQGGQHQRSRLAGKQEQGLVGRLAKAEVGRRD